jgi:hypothetical protein
LFFAYSICFKITISKNLCHSFIIL